MQEHDAQSGQNKADGKTTPPSGPADGPETGSVLGDISTSEFTPGAQPASVPPSTPRPDSENPFAMGGKDPLPPLTGATKRETARGAIESLDEMLGPLAPSRDEEHVNPWLPEPAPQVAPPEPDISPPDSVLGDITKPLLSDRGIDARNNSDPRADIPHDADTAAPPPVDQHLPSLTGVKPSLDAQAQIFGGDLGGSMPELAPPAPEPLVPSGGGMPRQLLFVPIAVVLLVLAVTRFATGGAQVAASSAAPTTTSAPATPPPATAGRTASSASDATPLVVHAQPATYVPASGCGYSVFFSWQVANYGREQVSLHVRKLDGSLDTTQRFAFTSTPLPTMPPDGGYLGLGGSYLSDKQLIVYINGDDGPTAGWSAEITAIGNHPLSGERISSAPARAC